MRCEHSPYIQQIILYNNQNPYTVALIVPDKEKLKQSLSLAHTDYNSLEGKQAAIRLIQKEMDRFRKGGDLASMFPDRWLPSTFAVLPEPFTEQNGMVNSTMKIVRGKVEKIYAERINYLYAAEGKNPLNQKNFDAL